MYVIDDVICLVKVITAALKAMVTSSSSTLVTISPMAVQVYEKKQESLL